MEELATQDTSQRESGISVDVSEVPRESGDPITTEDFIGFVFNDYIDHGIDILVKAGLPERDALEAIFQVATVLAEQKALPAFPDDEAAPEDLGAWLVQAKDLEFFACVLEALSE